MGIALNRFYVIKNLNQINTENLQVKLQSFRSTKPCTGVTTTYKWSKIGSGLNLFGTNPHIKPTFLSLFFL